MGYILIALFQSSEFYKKGGVKLFENLFILSTPVTNAKKLLTVVTCCHSTVLLSFCIIEKI
jgi:hypothetical protein